MTARTFALSPRLAAMPVSGSSNLAPGTDPVPGAIQARPGRSRLTRNTQSRTDRQRHAAHVAHTAPTFAPITNLLIKLFVFKDFLIIPMATKHIHQCNVKYCRLRTGHAKAALADQDQQSRNGLCTPQLEFHFSERENRENNLHRYFGDACHTNRRRLLEACVGRCSVDTFAIVCIHTHMNSRDIIAADQSGWLAAG